MTQSGNLTVADRLPRQLRVSTSAGRAVGVCDVADRPWTRIRGLLGRTELPQATGLLIVPCPSIHMWGMKFPIDAIFLTRDNQIADWVENLAPGRYYVAKKDVGKPYAALELPAGTIESLQIARGERLVLENWVSEEGAVKSG